MNPGAVTWVPQNSPVNFHWEFNASISYTNFRSVAADILMSKSSFRSPHLALGP